MALDLPKYESCIVLSACEQKGSIRLIRARHLQEAVEWDKDQLDAHGKRRGRCLDLQRDSFSLPRVTVEIQHHKLKIVRQQYPRGVWDEVLQSLSCLSLSWPPLPCLSLSCIFVGLCSGSEQECEQDAWMFFVFGIMMC